MMGGAGFTKNSSNIKVDGIPPVSDQRYRDTSPSSGLFVCGGPISKPALMVSRLNTLPWPSDGAKGASTASIEPFRCSPMSGGGRATQKQAPHSYGEGRRQAFARAVLPSPAGCAWMLAGRGINKCGRSRTAGFGWSWQCWRLR
jgi:hypothetical protein